MSEHDRSPAPDPSTVTTRQEFIACLRATVQRAGNPTSRGLAEAVTALRYRRAAHGEQVKEAAHSTINNLLRQTDRTRIDHDLVFDLLTVVGVPLRSRESWQAAMTKVFGGTVVVTRVERRLPLDLPDFVGREDALAALTEAKAGSVILVTAIEGMAGLGKTSLAVRAAHQLLAQGRFSDVQLHIDLRGFDVEGRAPADPYEVLEQLLRALRGPGQVPMSWRTGRGRSVPKSNSVTRCSFWTTPHPPTR